jgi:uncharacterized protein (DUF1015 family)
MAEIRPFRGVRYNQEKNDPARVICPPYDVINTQQQDELYRRSEYNFIRIEYNREQPGDTAQENRYSRASAYLAGWLEQGILRYESEPALYIHEHVFHVLGKQIKRQNILTLVKLEEWEKKVVRPHENIIPRAKSDRMSMLRACQANTSPVLSMYEDPERRVSSLIQDEENKAPVIDCAGEEAENHKVWAVTSPETIRKIQLELAQRPLYIADGHHRYDSALTYRRERISQAERVTGEEGFNFVMMCLIDIADPGLVILPAHRLVKGIPRTTLGSLKKELNNYFYMDEYALETPGLWAKVDALFNVSGTETAKTRLVVYGLDSDRLQVLTLRDFKQTAGLMPAEHGDLYKSLDVSLVDHIILGKTLAYQKDRDEILLDYCDDRQEAVNRVKDGSFQLAFILNPVKPELIKAIADMGDRMPRKSTYFFPKAPAGLVFYKW